MERDEEEEIHSHDGTTLVTSLYRCAESQPKRSLKAVSEHRPLQAAGDHSDPDRRGSTENVKL